MLSIKKVELGIGTGQLSVSIMWLGGISCHSVWGMIFQWGSTLKVSIELPVTSRHHRDMTERLLNAMLSPNQTNNHVNCLHCRWFLWNIRQAYFLTGLMGKKKQNFRISATALCDNESPILQRETTSDNRKLASLASHLYDKLGMFLYYFL